MEKLVRVDRNGTEYWEDNVCPKCGGTGYIEYFQYVEGGRCFECQGTGHKHQAWKVYTPEYRAKLEAQRIKRYMAKAPAANEKKLRCLGFENGSIYTVPGDTYAIKDQLKKAGAMFSQTFGWFFKERVGENLVKVDTDEVLEKDEYGYLQMKSDAKRIVETKKREANPSKSEHLHEVGEKIDLKLKLARIATYDTHYTYYGEVHCIYTFEDADGNVYVWKTQAGIDANIGDEVEVKGTVKENGEYKGVKQTVLTRCRIA